MWRLTRRSWFRATGLASLAGGVATSARLAGQGTISTGSGAAPHGAHSFHAMGTVGRVSKESFDPVGFLRSWNFSHLSSTERARFYRETPRPDGSLLREYEIFAVDRE